MGLVSPRDLVDIGDDPMVGLTLEGRYTILAKLGAGSMGTVYRAKQHAMGREVAIKILRGDRAVDDSAKARFMREARANSLLASPNTVPVFDFGQSESGEFYLAMELLEGESLGQRITRVGRLPAPMAVDACRQALRSLGEAHAKGIIHRDLKPDNLFFARVLTSTTASTTGGDDTQAHDEIVKVLDFGIAKMVNADDPNPMSVVETQAGTVFGTPRYMSPEQAQGKPLDARSDLYSLAVILYQMLTGRPPFTDNDAVVVMARHIKSTPKRPNEAVPEAMIPTELEDVIMRTLAKEPKDRPGSAEIFAGELLAALGRKRRQLQTDDRAIVLRGHADIAGQQRLLDRLERAFVPRLDQQLGRLGHGDAGDLADRHHRAVGIHLDVFDHRRARAPGADAAELVRQLRHRLVEFALGVGDQVVIAHGNPPAAGADVGVRWRRSEKAQDPVASLRHVLTNAHPTCHPPTSVPGGRSPNAAVIVPG